MWLLFFCYGKNIVGSKRISNMKRIFIINGRSLCPLECEIIQEYDGLDGLFLIGAS